MNDTAKDLREPGFFHVDNEVITDYNLHPYALSLYIVIVYHANRKSGEAFPSVAKLAKLTRMSKPAVIKYTEELETAGLIEVHRELRPGTKERMVNHYFVKKVKKSHTPDENTEGGKRDLPRSQPHLPQVVNDVDSNKTHLNKTQEQDYGNDLPEADFQSQVEQPSNEIKPKKAAKPRKSNPMVDAVIQHLFEKDPATCETKEKKYAGTVAGWLAGTYTPSMMNVKQVEQPATPDDIKAIGELYRRECPDKTRYNAIRSIPTIQNWYNKLLQERKTAQHLHTQRVQGQKQSMSQSEAYLRIVMGVNDDEQAA